MNVKALVASGSWGCGEELLSRGMSNQAGMTVSEEGLYHH